MDGSEYNLIGPFRELVTLDGIPERGPVKNDQLNIQKNMGILIKNGNIAAIGGYQDMIKDYLHLDPQHARIENQ